MRALTLPRAPLGLSLALLSLGCGGVRAGALAPPSLLTAPVEKQQGHDASAVDADPGVVEGGVAEAGVSEADGASREGPRCREQPPLPEMLRQFYLNNGHAAHHLAIRRRTEWYGYFEGFGRAEWNAHPPLHYAERTHFFGIPVRLHRRIVPALACVEAELRRSCSHVHYRPADLNGIRPANSFAGGEVSNHVYGIALDIDPQRNPCCGCGESFRNHPRCQGPARSIYDRTQMPECWVRVFERYGFAWGGNDRGLRDTMHFEFLADPERIAAP